MRHWGQTETQEVACEREEMFFYREGNQALEQVSQRRCGVSVLGDIKKPYGYGPGQPALGGPA